MDGNFFGQGIGQIRDFLDKKLDPKKLPNGQLENIAFGVGVACEMVKRLNPTPGERKRVTPLGYTVGEFMERYESAVKFYGFDPQELTEGIGLV